MTPETEFDGLIKPLEQLSVLLFYPSCFSHKKPKVLVAFCWILCLNTLLLDAQLVYFTHQYVLEKDLSKVIISASLVIMHFYCHFCGFFFLLYRQEFRRLLDWCRSRHQHCQAEFMQKFVRPFILVNFGLVMSVFVGTVPLNLISGKIVIDSYPIHLPGLGSYSTLGYLINTVHQVFGALYTIGPWICYFTGFFIGMKYIYDQLNFMMKKLKHKVTTTTLKSVIDMHADVVEIFGLISDLSSLPLLFLQVEIFPAAFLGWFGWTIDPAIRVTGTATSSLVFEFFFYFYINEVIIEKVTFHNFS